MIGHNQIALYHKALHSLLGLITPERNSAPHNTKRIIPLSLNIHIYPKKINLFLSNKCITIKQIKEKKGHTNVEFCRIMEKLVAKISLMIYL